MGPTGAVALRSWHQRHCYPGQGQGENEVPSDFMMACSVRTVPSLWDDLCDQRPHDTQNTWTLSQMCRVTEHGRFLTSLCLDEQRPYLLLTSSWPLFSPLPPSMTVLVSTSPFKAQGSGEC